MTDRANSKITPQQDFWTHMRIWEIERVRLALEAGANPNLPEEGQQPALTQTYHASGFRKQPESAAAMVRLLLKHGADPNIRTRTIEGQWIGGRTALMLLVQINDLPAVQALLEGGADVNAAVVKVDSGDGKNTAYLGMTSLHVAATRGLEDMALLLLAYGANPQAKDNDNNTPAQVATEKQYHEVARIIQAHMDRDTLRRSAGLEEPDWAPGANLGSGEAQDQTASRTKTEKKQFGRKI